MMTLGKAFIVTCLSYINRVTWKIQDWRAGPLVEAVLENPETDQTSEVKRAWVRGTGGRVPLCLPAPLPAAALTDTPPFRSVPSRSRLPAAPPSHFAINGDRAYAQRARRWCAEGKPVRAWTVPSARTPGPHQRKTNRRTYDATALSALNAGRNPACCRAAPKPFHGPFTCTSCKFTCLRTCTAPAKPRTSNYQLKCILLNTRSVHRHAVELWNLLDTTSPDVAFLTETWMNASSAPDIAIAIPDGYKIIRRDRVNQTGGGIAIIHKNTIRITTADEHLHFQIHTDPKTTLRGTLIYRPPGPRTQFSEDIMDFISPHALPSADYILLGDLNFHLENNMDRNTIALLDNLANLGLKQLVNTPTHYAGHTLDPVFSSSKHIAFNHSNGLHWTDHSCVHFSFRKTTTHHHPQQAPHRSWSRITADQLTTSLSQNPPDSTPDPNEAARNFTQWLTACADDLTPLKNPPSKPRGTKAPWFTDELKDSKKTCRTLEKAWLHDRTTDNMTALKHATRKHHQLIRTTKKKSLKERLDNNAHDSKELFSIVKEFFNPSTGNNITPSQDLCDSLASFFHRKIADIHNSFGTPSLHPTVKPTHPTTTLRTWTAVTTEDTARTMNTIHSGSPTDPCPHHVFNKADSTIAPQLRDVINTSFDTATFPESWKHAELSALLKKPTADPTDLKNFRPVSLLPFPAKVIEKIGNRQLAAFLETNGSLDPSLSGFRANHSTETALHRSHRRHPSPSRQRGNSSTPPPGHLRRVRHCLPPHPSPTPQQHRHPREGIEVDHLVPRWKNTESSPPPVSLRSHQSHLRRPARIIPQPHPLQRLHETSCCHRTPTQPQHHLLCRRHPADPLPHQRPRHRQNQPPRRDERRRRVDEEQLLETELRQDGSPHPWTITLRMGRLLVAPSPGHRPQANRPRTQPGLHPGLLPLDD
ncbi:hypothetical protein NDU88_004491 [Pleurodeles waltl]|uniref:Endonuclease/exonuclease/phosphatase domain-containing protein n=1 Tax=Pleurodeles waltl TaxID=8319 RepID=A0AAV7L1L9_PLEWA|nr:hypothetical protein NDU88_004491 [Pleurodeles waltl]